LAAPQLRFGEDRLRLLASLERSHFWFVARRQLVDGLVGRALGPGSSRAVDVGCGTGSLAQSLASRGVHVLALDLHATGLQRLRSAVPGIWVAVADADHLPIAGGAFDTAVALDVLEHTDDRSVIREIARVLRPGGAVVMTVPALPWLWSARDEAAGHRRRYRRRDVIRLLAEAGLRVEDVRFYQCLLLPAFVATRLLSRQWVRALRTEEQPTGWLNRLGLAINRFEVRAGDRIRWPWGSSLAALARKPA
jgi:SAM-dependent methyltransferase